LPIADENKCAAVRSLQSPLFLSSPTAYSTGLDWQMIPFLQLFWPTETKVGQPL